MNKLTLTTIILLLLYPSFAIAFNAKNLATMKFVKKEDTKFFYKTNNNDSIIISDKLFVKFLSAIDKDQLIEFCNKNQIKFIKQITTDIALFSFASNSPAVVLKAIEEEANVAEVYLDKYKKASLR